MPNMADHAKMHVQRRATNAPTSNSASALVSTLIPVLVLSGIFFLVFLILRRTLQRQYAPRTFLSTLRPQERTPALPTGMFNWTGKFSKIPDSWVLNHQSMDGYLLLRFLKISTIICVVGCVITFIILWPINATGGGGSMQLDVLSIMNVAPPNNPRLYAHTFVGWLFYGFVWYMIARETIYYINIRQAYLLSPLYRHRMSSRTVLFTSVPMDFCVSGKIRQMYGNTMKNFWISTDCKALDKLVKERDKAAYKLEAAEIKLIKKANKNRLAAQKKNKSGDASAAATGNHADIEGESGSVAARWIKPSDRPTHRTKFLIGKKVDTINWCRAELERLNPIIEAQQAEHRADKAKPVGAVFVEFHKQSDAQAAYQSLTHHQPLHMAPRFIGVNPDSIIWSNLRIKWWERVLRSYVTIAFVCLLIIFWALPVAFVGVLSNIGELRDQFSWLHWMHAIPDVIFGVVSGLLPAILLAVLMALLPIILRLAAKLGGAPTLAAVELRTQHYYYAFQVVQVFLVATLASAATSVVPSILKDPTSAPNLLATHLPQAYILYVAYFILQGLSFASGALLQLVGLILFRVLSKVLDNTPRKIYKRWTSLSGLGWGTVFPVYTLMIAIALIYAMISPLVFLFAAIGLWLTYIAFRYNLLFVFNANIDTQGLVYPRALQHLTVGIYIGLVCMIGLFAINEAPGPAVLTVIFLIGSILFHVSLNSAVDPLLKALPRSLEVEEDALLAQEAGRDPSPNGTLDDQTRGAPTRDSTAMSKGDVDRTDTGAHSLPPPHKKPSMFAKFFKPHVYTDYATLRRLVPRDFAEISYTSETERNAYYDPSISSTQPLLWLPRDTMGISRQEVAHSSKVIPITDDDSTMDDQGKIHWDTETRPPIYQEKVYY